MEIFDAGLGFGARPVRRPRADLSSLSLLPLTSTDSAIPFAFVLALAGWMPHLHAKPIQ